MIKQLTNTEGNVWAFMKRAVIPDIADPTKDYLIRYRLIQTPWFGVYLHKILLPDNDINTHDHPFNFVSIILRGGYRERYFARFEHRLPARRCYTTGSIHKMKTTEFHSIKELVRIPTWTLLFTGPRLKEWGYRIAEDIDAYIPVSIPDAWIARKDYDWHKYN